VGATKPCISLCICSQHHCSGLQSTGRPHWYVHRFGSTDASSFCTRANFGPVHVAIGAFFAGKRWCAFVWASCMGRAVDPACAYVHACGP
jgi:hypothetical protein